MKYIGRECFGACYGSNGITEITLPRTLRTIGEKAFGGCEHLKVVWVEAGCAANVRELVDSDVEVQYK